MRDGTHDHTEVDPKPTTVRVTVTLPAEVVRDIDRLERNRSRFVLESSARSCGGGGRKLRRSLRRPHPESGRLAEAGFDECGARLAFVPVGFAAVRALMAVRPAPRSGRQSSSRIPLTVVQLREVPGTPKASSTRRFGKP